MKIVGSRSVLIETIEMTTDERVKLVSFLRDLANDVDDATAEYRADLRRMVRELSTEG